MSGAGAGVGIDLRPSAPWFIQDFGASVLQQALMSQAAAADDSLLLCNVGFCRMGEKLDWRMLFVPTPGLQAALERLLHVVPEGSK